MVVYHILLLLSSAMTLKRAYETCYDITSAEMGSIGKEAIAKYYKLRKDSQQDG